MLYTIHTVIIIYKTFAMKSICHQMKSTTLIYHLLDSDVK